MRVNLRSSPRGGERATVCLGVDLLFVVFFLVKAATINTRSVPRGGERATVCLDANPTC